MRKKCNYPYQKIQIYADKPKIEEEKNAFALKCFKNQYTRGCMKDFVKQKKKSDFLFLIQDFSRIEIVIYAKFLRNTALGCINVDFKKNLGELSGNFQAA